MICLDGGVTEHALVFIVILRLVKKGVHPKPITLSIGDGANDVAMIQEAQVCVDRGRGEALSV